MDRWGTSKGPLRRRDFLKRTALGTAGFALASSLPGFSTAASDEGEISRVVIVTDQSASSGTSIVADVVRTMMDRGIMELTDEATVGDAWRSLFPGITSFSCIGIKVNCINYRLSSHPEVAQAIVEGLATMEVEGVSFPRNNIIIWDRTNSELTNAGYTIYTGSEPNWARCFGTNQYGVGYDDGAQIDVHGRTCRPSLILSQYCDYLINLSVMKNHTMAGVTFSLKNHLGSIHNPSALHGYSYEHCDPYVPALNQRIRDQLGVSQVVSICDGILGISSGGPDGPPQFVYNGLLMSCDPVALDYQGMLVLQDQGCQTIGMATHIATAASAPYHLGTNDPQLMEVRHIIDPATRVTDDAQPTLRPGQSHLGFPYPNPFNGRTVIPYHLGGSGAFPVCLEVFNVAGQRVTTLFQGMRQPGDYQAVWDGRDERGTAVACGIYLCRLQTPDDQMTTKLSLLR